MAPRKIKVVDLVTDNIEETVCEKVEDVLCWSWGT